MNKLPQRTTALQDGGLDANDGHLVRIIDALGALLARPGSHFYKEGRGVSAGSACDLKFTFNLKNIA